MDAVETVDACVLRLREEENDFLLLGGCFEMLSPNGGKADNRTCLVARREIYRGHHQFPANESACLSSAALLLRPQFRTSASCSVLGSLQWQRQKRRGR